MGKALSRTTIFSKMFSQEWKSQKTVTQFCGAIEFTAGKRVAAFMYTRAAKGHSRSMISSGTLSQACKSRQLILSYDAIAYMTANKGEFLSTMAARGCWKTMIFVAMSLPESRFGRGDRPYFAKIGSTRTNIRQFGYGKMARAFSKTMIFAITIRVLGNWRLPQRTSCAKKISRFE